MGVDLGHALNAHQGGLGLGHQGDIRQVDDVPVAEHGLVDTLHQILGVVAHEVVHGLGAGDKLHGADVVQRRDLALQRRRLFLGIGLVHKGHDLVLVFQALDDGVDIHRQQGHAADDDQAGHDNGHRGEGHESVRGDAAEAFANQISASTQSHSCSTHPFRR